jgi:type IV pilus assembly protein PilP
VDHFRPEAPEAVQRRVTMPDVTVEQMHLVAIITRLPQPRAMLVDPSGVGHVVKRGDFVGRAEVVRAGGADGMPVTLNWRVDRIRANELVLTREDPTSPDSPPLSRVLALYEEDELALSQITGP